MNGIRVEVTNDNGDKLTFANDLDGNLIIQVDHAIGHEIIQFEAPADKREAFLRALAAL